MARELTGELRRQLGAFGYQWLCACAVYPGLRIALTVHLGNVIARQLNRPDPSEMEIRALSSLRWFRNGKIPLKIRGMLVDDLIPVLRLPVREAIAQYLFEVIEFGDRRTSRYSLVDFASPPNHWRGALNALLPTKTPRNILRDDIFVSHMVRSRLTFGAFAIQGKLANLLGARWISVIDMPLVATFVAAGLLAFAASNWNPDVQQAGRNSDVGQTTRGLQERPQPEQQSSKVFRQSNQIPPSQLPGGKSEPSGPAGDLAKGTGEAAKAAAGQLQQLLEQNTQRLPPSGASTPP
jgi:hypothetical protein